MEQKRHHHTRYKGVAYVAHAYTARAAVMRQRNVVASQALAARLVADGWVVINPLMASLWIEEVISEDEWVEHGLTLLDICDAFHCGSHCLEHSRGVRREYDHAVACGMAVYVDGVQVEVGRG